ncbi:MAG: nucleotidyl transferase AbiEii/AbiGii toxin family protein [Acidiferrobacteraceae bacterium]
MSLFDILVDEALKNQQDLSPLRAVVEKELLHHDILRVLSGEGMLTHLTFMGGTCLRACYGSHRLSEDLDFTGGTAFSRDSLSAMAQVLADSLKIKYGLDVEVNSPVCDVGRVATWKLKMQTRPGRKDLSAQRINIDICAIPSYQAKPRLLLNPYGVEMGTGGLILQAESREEIFADKIVAFALRPNRIKNRDLWDMAWLYQQGIKPAMDLLAFKLKDHRSDPQEFLRMLDTRAKLLATDPKVAAGFWQEMSRFLPVHLMIPTVEQGRFWEFLMGLMDELCGQARKSLQGETLGSTFPM